MAVNPNVKHKEDLDFNGRIALKITSWVGTMVCAYVFAALALIALPPVLGMHIIPDRTLLVIQWVSQTFIQLVLLSVIMVGQDLQNKHSELRAQATFELAQEIHDHMDQLEQQLHAHIDQIQQ